MHVNTTVWGEGEQRKRVTNSTGAGTGEVLGRRHVHAAAVLPVLELAERVCQLAQNVGNGACLLEHAVCKGTHEVAHGEGGDARLRDTGGVSDGSKPHGSARTIRGDCWAYSPRSSRPGARQS